MKHVIKKILLAEDDPNDAELTLTALKKHNFVNEVDWVKDGQEVLDYLKKEEQYEGREGGAPALVLLDLKMPKLTGIEVLKKIRADEKLRTLPVVALTSSQHESDLSETYNLGVNAYVVKPVDFCQFVEAVKEIGAFWVMYNETPQIN